MQRLSHIFKSHQDLESLKIVKTNQLIDAINGTLRICFLLFALYMLFFKQLKMQRNNHRKNVFRDPISFMVPGDISPVTSNILHISHCLILGRLAGPAGW